MTKPSTTSLQLEFEATTGREQHTVTCADLNRIFSIQLFDGPENELGAPDTFEARGQNFNTTEIATNPSPAVSKSLTRFMMYMNFRVAYPRLTEALTEWVALRSRFGAVADVASLVDDGHAVVITVAISLGDRNDVLFVAPGDAAAPMRADVTLAQRAFLLMKAMVNGSMAEFTPHFAASSPSENGMKTAREALATHPGCPTIAEAILKTKASQSTRRSQAAMRPRHA